MSLEYDIATSDERVSLVLKGRIDREAAPVLETAYLDAAVTSAQTVVLDFHSVEYINSTGIALIVGLLGRARADGRTVEAAGLTEHYRHIFDITRLSDFITIIEPSQSRRGA